MIFTLHSKEKNIFGGRVIKSPGNRATGSIFDIFKTAQPANTQQQQPNQQQGQQGNQPPMANPSITNPNPLPGVDPNNPTVPQGNTDPNKTNQQQQTQQSPLDGFKDFWQTPETPKNQQQSVVPTIDPAKLQEAVGKVNFAPALTPEQLQAIAAGGEQAIKVQTELVNQAARNAFTQSMTATNKIVEQALAKQAEQFQAQLPTLVKNFSVQENLASTNPILHNPAVRPVVDAVRQQLIMKNPNATAAEIQTQVLDFLGAVSQAVGKPTQQNTQSSQQQSRAAEQDWSKFLD